MDRYQYHRYTEYHSNNAMGRRIAYTNLVEAERKCVQKYFCCKRTLAIVTYVDQFSVQSSQRAIQARHSLHSTCDMRPACCTTHMNHLISQRRRCRNGLLIMWLFESTRIRNLYFFFIWFIFLLRRPQAAQSHVLYVTENVRLFQFNIQVKINY